MGQALLDLKKTDNFVPSIRYQRAVFLIII
jgi:hypothetical protein